MPDFWESTELLDRLAVIRPTRPFMAPDAVPLLVKADIDCEQFKRKLVADIGADEGSLYDAVRRAQQHQSGLPFTLCHGDCHIENIYLLPDRKGGLLYWQLAARGYCRHDISYLIITAL